MANVKNNNFTVIIITMDGRLTIPVKAQVVKWFNNFIVITLILNSYA